ncbi:MAG: hypothetical protein GVY07_04995 [Bacteroidetes bacterium]|jgi:hypothetical protein|nr:hypothetical protein [Bacteroidota bacterium]
MKKVINILVLAFLSPWFFSCSQAQNSVNQIESKVSQDDLELNIHFLSSDELRGRATGTPEVDISAKYIADWFNAYDLSTAPVYDSYFQEFNVTMRDSSIVKSKNVIGLIEGSDPALR